MGVAVALLAALCLGLPLNSSRAEPAAPLPGGYSVLATWRSAPSQQSLDAWWRPSGVAVDAGGRIYVADADEPGLKVIEVDGQVARFGPEPNNGSDLAAPELMASPGALAVDDGTGRLYVADPGAAQVVVFDLSGSHVATWPGVPEPVGIGVGANGIVYVASASTGEVLAFSPEGVAVGRWTAERPPPAQPGPGGSQPVGALLAGLEVGPDNRIYVLSRVTSTVIVLGADGREVDTIRLAVPAVDLAMETGFDGGAERLWLATDQGIYRQDVGERYAEPNPIGTVTALALSAKRGLVAVQPARAGLSARVVQYRYGKLNGTPEAVWGRPVNSLGALANPFGLQLAADGFVYLLDSGARVQWWDASGRPDGQVAVAAAIAVDAAPDGTLFVADDRRLLAFGPPVTTTLGVDPTNPGPAATTRRLLWSRDLAGPDGLGGPGAVAFNPLLDEVAVLDVDGEAVRRFSRSGAPRGSARLNLPAGVRAIWNDLAADGAGRLYVLDRKGPGVLTIEWDGSQRWWTLAGSATRLAAGPGSDGRIYTLARDGWVRRYQLPLPLARPPMPATATAGPSPTITVPPIVTFVPQTPATPGTRTPTASATALPTATPTLVPATPTPVPTEMTTGVTVTVEAAFDAVRFDVARDSMPSDLTVAGDGSVLVTDRDAGLVTTFGPDAGAKSQTPPDRSATCRNYPDKTASPGEIWLGETVEVRLTLRGGCGADVSTTPLDVILILDDSGSMAGQKLRLAQQAALEFVAQMDLSLTQVGVVGFNTVAQLASPLTYDEARITRAVQRLTANGGTSIDRGLASALTEWRRHGRPGVKAAFVLLSDGYNNAGPAPVLREAKTIKDAGVEIYTVDLQGDAATMQKVASSPDHYFRVDTASRLPNVFEAIGRSLSTGTLYQTITVTDRIPGNMRYVLGSAVPSAVFDPGAQTLRWTLTGVSFLGFSLRYRLEPLEVGEWPTNVVAWGDYVDGLAHLGRVDFPVPRVRVRSITRPTTPTPLPSVPPTPTVTPTPSPSPTPTPTPTPTPKPRPIYLPILLTEPPCADAFQYTDVALVIDASTSMLETDASGRTKLEATRDAARLFVGLLNLAGDQAAVITFNVDSALLQPLTGDRALLDAALDRIQVHEFTRIDLGIAEGHRELTSVRHRPDHTRTLVLLTDGRSNPVPVQMALDAAAAAKSEGVRVFTIGVGADVEADALRAMATAPEDYFFAPGADAIEGIYRQIAHAVIRCGRDGFWPGNEQQAGPATTLSQPREAIRRQ